LPEADFPQMNFTQMHERLRLELLRRIQRGTLSVSLLSRQTGFGQSHLSNFLRTRRQLSLEAVDRVLAAQHLTAADLLPALQSPSTFFIDEERNTVPVVSHHAALFEPHIRPSAARFMMHVPKGLLEKIHARASHPRRTWQRFVAVQLSEADAQPMEPMVLPDALALIDRHYNSIAQYRPNRANLFAIRDGPALKVRFAEVVSNRLVLRPLHIGFPIDLLEIEPGETPADLITGRIVLILNEP
jgi:hypothetical protein